MESAKIVLDPFCFKSFEEVEGKPPMLNFDQKEFTDKVNAFYLENKDTELKDGYAPFCKHLFIPNFTDALDLTAKITPENEHLIKTAYEARRETELPVLSRWFDKNDIKAEKAEYLDIILYSYDQIQVENESMKSVDPNKDISYDYGIISVKPQSVNHELPMQPITMMRNTLGKEYGGSGVPFDEQKYRESVAYWTEHNILK